MRSFSGQSADIVWQQAAVDLLNQPDYIHRGRNGDTREILSCVLWIQNPRRRWVLSRRPPYNPAFGLVEFIWILTGNNESYVPNYWNPSLQKYSGTGKKYHGAYGYRLRHEFGFDQIKRVFEVLSNSPETRQAVLQIWKPEIDLPNRDGNPVSPDIPCNVMSLLKIRDGRLHWTQIMRSNDIIRGLPYNIIQFTLLQEMMASWLGCDLGEYLHLSDSLHIYERDTALFKVEPTTSFAAVQRGIALSYYKTIDLFTSIYHDLRVVADGNQDEYKLRITFDRESKKNRFRSDLIKNIMVVIGSDAARRHGFFNLAHEFAESCTDAELRCAAIAWLINREGAE